MTQVIHVMAFPGGTVVKNPSANVGDAGSIPGLGRSPGEGNDNSLQHSCLKNSMDRGDWWAVVHGTAKESDMNYQLNNNNNKDTCYKIQSRKVYYRAEDKEYMNNLAQILLSKKFNR